MQPFHDAKLGDSRRLMKLRVGNQPVEGDSPTQEQENETIQNVECTHYYIQCKYIYFICKDSCFSRLFSLPEKSFEVQI